MNALLRRSLIQSTNSGLTLQSVVMEYVTEVFIDSIIHELNSCELYSCENNFINNEGANLAPIPYIGGILVI